MDRFIKQNKLCTVTVYIQELKVLYPALKTTLLKVIIRSDKRSWWVMRFCKLNTVFPLILFPLVCWVLYGWLGLVHCHKHTPSPPTHTFLIIFEWGVVSSPVFPMAPPLTSFCGKRIWDKTVVKIKFCTCMLSIRKLEYKYFV